MRYVTWFPILLIGLIGFASESAASEVSEPGPEVFIGDFAAELLEVAGIHCETCFEGGGTHTFNHASCGAGGGSDQDGFQVEFAGVGASASDRPHLDGEEDCYDCHSFNSCHDNVQQGSCSGSHDECHPTEDLDLLEAAVLSQTPEAIVRLVSAGKLRVAYTQERSAIQVLDCSGRIAGQYVVPALWFEVLLDG